MWMVCVWDSYGNIHFPLWKYSPSIVLYADWNCMYVYTELKFRLLDKLIIWATYLLLFSLLFSREKKVATKKGKPIQTAMVNRIQCLVFIQDFQRLNFPPKIKLNKNRFLWLQFETSKWILLNQLILIEFIYFFKDPCYFFNHLILVYVFLEYYIYILKRS